MTRKGAPWRVILPGRPDTPMSDTSEMVESGVLAKPIVIYLNVLKNRTSPNPFKAHCAEVEWTFWLSPEEREASREAWLMDRMADLALNLDDPT